MATEKRLIDANELIKEICRSDEKVGTSLWETPEIADFIDEMPTVDAVEVVHGRWVDNGIPESMLSGCSVCGFTCGAYSFNYCPNCGAKMDGERKDK